MYSLSYTAARHIVWSKLGREGECGGLLGGSLRRIAIARPVPNVAAEYQVHYVMEPSAQLAAVNSIESLGAELIGTFHFHPGGEADLSESDRLTAEGLGLSLIIGTKAEEWDWVLYDPDAGGRVPFFVQPPRAPALWRP